MKKASPSLVPISFVIRNKILVPPHIDLVHDISRRAELGAGCVDDHVWFGIAEETAHGCYI